MGEEGKKGDVNLSIKFGAGLLHGVCCDSYLNWKTVKIQALWTE